MWLEGAPATLLEQVRHNLAQALPDHHLLPRPGHPEEPGLATIYVMKCAGKVAPKREEDRMVHRHLPCAQQQHARPLCTGDCGEAFAR